jgi:hypothetical protein
MINSGEIVIPSSPDQVLKIKNSIKEISNSMTRIESEKDLIKEILGSLEEEFQLPKKYMKKVAVTYHKQNLNQIKEEFSEIEGLYSAINP